MRKSSWRMRRRISRTTEGGMADVTFGALNVVTHVVGILV